MGSDHIKSSPRIQQELTLRSRCFPSTGKAPTTTLTTTPTTSHTPTPTFSPTPTPTSTPQATLISAHYIPHCCGAAHHQGGGGGGIN